MSFQSTSSVPILQLGSGSTFDSFLDEEGFREEVEAIAIKRVLAWQLEQAMRKQQKTKWQWPENFIRAGRNWIGCLTRGMFR